ncbi:MAG: hypothetical protein ACKN9T_01680, partial [Candidatus Methylumidiphilus sp.]
MATVFAIRILCLVLVKMYAQRLASARLICIHQRPALVLRLLATVRQASISSMRTCVVSPMVRAAA